MPMIELATEEKDLLRRLAASKVEDSDTTAERLVVNCGLARRVDPGMLEITEAGRLAARTGKVERHPFHYDVFCDLSARIEDVAKSRDPRLESAVRRKLEEAAHAIWEAWNLQSELERAAGLRA
ncbi:hypothetical protein DYI24_00155 [Rhodopseudomonas sp. BR0C11]|uniref:hypothetical protein n=1 Tax=Rhodopseudomonas sp. BR0C11 TaxID=2269370 RepID=UPI0013DEE8C3|nr:hypothetical protein [Rhodopseudomonas sp. BR0C11]NEV75493.1 hypothetical protein [Rhodopseudomonas sp. BR0C11]